MPQQSPKRIQQLLKQYPFIAAIYRPEVKVPWAECEVEARITVKRGDPDLLFRRASNIDGVGSWSMDPDHPDQMGTRYEYYHPVNTHGLLGEIRHWQDWKDQYVRDLFNRECWDWIDQSKALRGEDPFEVVRGIVWVTRENWYPEGSDLSSTFHGVRPLRRNVRITYFRTPPQGWRELYRIADPQVNVSLYGWRLFDGWDLNNPFLTVITDRLNRLGQEFQQKVWATGLGKIIDESRMKGMSGQYGTVTVLSYVIAGRLRIQFERGGNSLTLGGFDEVDDPRIGFASIQGTLPRAEKLVRDVIRFWEKADDETRRTVHQDNPNVNMGF